MFLKPFKVKSNSLIRGSDRKKLRAQISNQLNIDASLLTGLVPNKEEMTVMKILTHSSDIAVVYNVKGTPAFFEIHGVLYPTVYTLWQHVDLLPAFTTWPPVFKKLLSGADLMLPGVIPKGEVGPKRCGDLTLPKGATCSVKLMGNKCPVAVGTTALSTEDMYMSAMRGKGVIVLHTYSDQLWALGNKSDPPHIDDTEMIAASKSQAGGDEENGENSSEDDTQTDSPIEHSSAGQAQPSDLPPIHGLSLECGGPEGPSNCLVGAESASRENQQQENDVDEVECEDKENTKEQMDELLIWCFMCALKSRVKKSDLPLLTSNFFRNHLQPCCPQGHFVDIKKSSYKKLSKFLKSMQDRGLIKVKELSKGAESIIEVTKDHLELKDFQAPEVAEEHKFEAAASAAASDAEFIPPEIVEMYTITAASQPIFKLAGYHKGNALTQLDIRKVLSDYIQTENLKSVQNKGQVILDPVLTDLLLNKNEYIESLCWEEIMTRTTAKMSPAFSVGLPGQRPVVKKGKLEPVTFTVVQRGGNKKVTLIHNLEVYGIDPQELGHRVQISRACSTAVSPRPGKTQSLELLVQGNQVNFVADLLLEKYKVPRKYLLGLEKAPKSKKKKVPTATLR